MAIQPRYTVHLVILAALCSVIAAVVYSAFSPPSFVNKDLVVAFLRPYLQPEPGETMGFLAVAVAGPLGAILISRVSIKEFPGLPSIVAIAFAGFMLNGDLLGTLVSGWKDPPQILAGVKIALAVVMAACVMFLPTFRAARPIAMLLTITAVIVQLAWRILGHSFTDADLSWSYHADPLFYVISQTVGGNTVLSDFPSQYGLYPEFLAPIFRLVQPSIFSFSIVFAMLQVAAIGFIVCVLSRTVQSGAILLVSGFALILITGENVFFFGGFRELYFQYWPIRFFWPAAVVLAFSCYIDRPNFRRAAVVSVSCAFGALWNADTGIVCLGAFTAYLVARALFLNDRRRLFLTLLLHVALSVTTVMLAMTYLAFKGGAIHLSWLVEYQRIFAGLGLAALPLPRKPSPWMAIVALYLWTLVISVGCWRRGCNKRADLLFFLAILGLGLFSYYVSRSHTLNLIKVMWPGILIAAILCDSTLTLIRAKELPREYLSPVLIALATLLLAANSLLAWMPTFIGLAFAGSADVPSSVNSIFSQEIELIRRNAPRGSKCMIAAKRQGVYQIEAGISSPLSGPGIMETVLQADQERLIKSIRDGVPKCLFLGESSTSATDMPITLSNIADKYRIVERVPTMFFLQAR